MSAIKLSIINKLKKHEPGILGGGLIQTYSVFLPLVEMEDEIHILFEVRSLEMRRQPGEVCFPGGKKDPGDASPEHTAVRELKEELGVDDSRVKEIYPLDYLVSPGMIVYPYAGFLSSGPYKLNPAEVDSVFTIPLSYFLETPPIIHRVAMRPDPEDDFPFEWIPGGRGYKWQRGPAEEYFYRYQDQTIWGLTARITAHFIELIRES